MVSALVTDLCRTIHMDDKVKYYRNSREWRDWLSQNHDKEKAVYLVIRKKHSKKAGIRYDEALDEALCFGWIDGKMQSVDDDSFILRFSPRKARSVWSLRNREKAQSLIAEGRMTDAGAVKIEEAKKNGLWDTAYTSLTAEDIPADLETALSQNRTARDNFHNLANTYRNMFIGWLNGARTKEARRQRIAEIVKRAELNQKIRYGSLEDTRND
jgi:uncharacterized protein YdeI (YjbR/CyaY-like superfamily)